MMSIQSSGRVTLFAKATLSLSIVLLMVAAVPLVTRERVTRDAPPLATQRLPKGRVDSGTELIALFIASSTCGASRHPTLPSALAQIRANLAADAKRESKRFVYVGVALDEFPATGLEFLKPYGPFDEIMTGGSWLNTGAVDYLIRGVPGPLAMPQLLVIERDVKAEGTAITISPDRVVARKLGFDEIMQFAGLPAPEQR